jgi:hypothetical protein
MNRILVGIVVLCGLFSIGLAGIAAANNAVDGDDWAMMVSPSTIVLDKVDMITVHTNIPLSAVDPDSITLDGEDAADVFPDNLGHLVAKFWVEYLQLVPDAENELTLKGDWKKGSFFRATDQVQVK